MDLYKSKLYMSDLDEMIEHTDILNEFRGKSFLIIGARGLICSAIADLLLYYNEKTDAGIHLYLVGRNKEKILERFIKYKNSKDLSVIEYDSDKENITSLLPHNISYIIDGIGPSSPGDIGAGALASLYSNLVLLKDLLEYACDEQVLSTLYISSSEIYGRSDKGGPFKEDDYGWVDILNPRSSYSSGKRSCETLCACYADEKNVNTVIARPGHIYGPSARKDDDHIAVSFSYEAAKGHDLKMKSEGLQLRSYCYMLDCASAMLTILIRGKSGQAYNISNKESVITLRDMMSLIAKAGNVSLYIGDNGDGSIKAATSLDNPMPDSSLDSGKLLALGWRGLFDAVKGADHTVQIIRQAID